MRAEIGAQFNKLARNSLEYTTDKDVSVPAILLFGFICSHLQGVFHPAPEQKLCKNLWFSRKQVIILHYVQAPVRNGRLGNWDIDIYEGTYIPHCSTNETRNTS